MANPEHLSLLTGSVADWNRWRTDNTDIEPNLSETNLGGANLQGADLHDVVLYKTYLRSANLDAANLHGANLDQADLVGATLVETDLSKARLQRAYLMGAKLNKADLTEADLLRGDLRGAILPKANLSMADLRRTNFRSADLTGATLANADLFEANLSQATLFGANLREADLRGANLSEANFDEADLADATLERASLIYTACNKANFTGCRIHGISAWDLRLADAKQANLIITPSGQSEITVDSLEVAQFIYLLLKNSRIREVIDTITSKVVLILGRFTPERKVVLNAIREKLRTKNYSPVVFDFEKPITRDLTETVMTLAGMAKFVIADLTDPKSIPHELMSFVRNLPSVPVQPLLLASQKQEYAMFEHLQRFPWVMETVLYQDQETLLRSLDSTVILPAEQKAKELITTQRK